MATPAQIVILFKGVGIPARALLINGVPVQINGHFILIGG